MAWLNQVEIFSSIIQRKAFSPNDFTDLGMLQERLARFEIRYNSTPGPFNWKFTTTKLADLLTRLDRHLPTDPAQAA